MNRLHGLLSLALVAVLAGCGMTVRVAVPPTVDLGTYRTVGLVTFSSNATGDLDRVSTQAFLQALQTAQPGTRVIELGSEQQVLASVGRSTWDAATASAVKQKHGVDALVRGQLDVTKVKPGFQVSTRVKSVSVKADVEASLTARLVETGTGATMWTGSAHEAATIATARFDDRGEGQIGITDPEAVYGTMIDTMVHCITDDFRVHYVTRRVRREAVQTASAGGS